MVRLIRVGPSHDRLPCLTPGGILQVEPKKWQRTGLVQAVRDALAGGFMTVRETHEQLQAAGRYVNLFVIYTVVRRLHRAGRLDRQDTRPFRYGPK